MNPFDLTDALDGMVILVDTREQDTRALRGRLRDMGRPYQREKLDFGDYSARFPLPNGDYYDLADKVAVERKMSLDELCQCFTHDRERFQREFERAKKAGARLWLLVEGGSWEKVYGGVYRSKMRSNALVASILAYAVRYGCYVVFCREGTSGALIRDILYREGKERMEALANGDE